MQKFYKYRLTCEDGGYGWGETGQVAEMCASGETEKDAAKHVAMQVPGGWRVELIGLTRDHFYLRHLPRVGHPTRELHCEG